MIKRNELTQDRAKQLFTYSNGQLIWCDKDKKKTFNKVAGYVAATGYRAVQVDGRQYLTHRIIYLMHHGFVPDYIDHINRDKQTTGYKT